MLFPLTDIKTETLTSALLKNKQVTLSVLRLDAIHPVVSGNKIFKLHYFLEKAIDGPYEGLQTFGGAYSNHLVATAYACKMMLQSIGIVRGEKPASLSPTLLQCMEYGMQLEFISRAQYSQKKLPDQLRPGYLVVPEGGYNPLGARGAALIMNHVATEVTHVCCAVGTATTLAGLLLSGKKEQAVLGFPVLKGMSDLAGRIEYLTNGQYNKNALQIVDGYHFGGYAKRTTELVDFMNDLYNTHGLATDFVYTAKMMFGIFDCIKKDHFKKGSNIVCIHTGGMQGNLSLPPGALVF